ncbi:MAG: hypothetical protein WAV47_04745 [Blastocatellia bacterium]
MNRVKKTACILLLVVTPALWAAPLQKATNKPASGDQQSRSIEPKGQPLDPKKRILSVLDQQLEAQKMFADENVRIAVQTTIADMVWGFDEPRARRLLEEAFQSIANIRIDERGRAGGLSYNVRYLVVRTIATRDPAMALRLLQTIEIPLNIDPKLTAIGMGNGLYVERARLQNDLAMYILMGEMRTGELRHSIQALKPFVDRGDLPRLISFARQIRVKDATAADEIFSQALAKARLGQPSFDDIRHLSWYVFPNLGEGIFRYSDKKVDPFETTPISAELLEQFLDLAYNAVIRRLDAALTNAEEGRLNVRSSLDYSLPKALAPHFDRFTPEKAAALRARIAEAARRVPPEEQPYLALSEPGIEALVSIADKLTDARIRDALYQNAATRAKYSGDLDRAAAIIEKISNEIYRSAQRDELRSQLDNNRIQQTYKAFEAKDLDKAEKLIGEITDQRQRLYLFGSLIVGGWIQKDRTRAVSMLDDAERRASGIDNPIERAWQLKMLAGITARIDRDRGFEKMGLAIEEFNRAGFVPEWEKHQVIETPAGVSIKNVYSGVSGLLDDRDFNWLGQTDLERALLLAERVHLKEASALAQLAACHGKLSRIQPQKQPITEKQKEAEKKALAQLDKIFEMSKSFEDVEVRIRIQAQIADLLWTRDETRARRMFEKAFQATAAVPLPAPDSSMPPSYVGSDSHFPLRNDLIRLVSQRDPGLAAKLIDSVIDQAPNVDQKFINGGYGTYSEQDMLRFQFALYITQSEPQRAAEMAARLLERGDIGRTLSIADALSRNEPGLADDLFAQTLLRVKQTKTPSQESIGLLANYIFPGFGEGVLRSPTGLRRRGASEGSAVSTVLRNQFLDVALEAVLRWIDLRQQSAPTPASPTNETTDLRIARLLLPYFDEHLSQKSAGVRARLEALPVESALARIGASTLEELLSKAEKITNASERDRVYWEAVMTAMRDRKVEQASAIIPKVSEERLRAQLESVLHRAKDQETQERVRVALDAADFETANRLINEVSDRSQRVSMLGNMAVVLSYKKDTTRAAQVLSVMEQLIAKSEDPTQRAQEMIRFVDVAARVDVERGFDAARLAVEALNRSTIIPQWMKVENVTDSTGRTVSRRQVGLQLLGSFLFDNSFSALGRSDFDRALQLAQALEMKEASAFAQLGVCRGVLK